MANMKIEIKVITDDNKESSFIINRSSSDDPKNLNDFILEALSISQDKR